MTRSDLVEVVQDPGRQVEARGRLRNELDGAPKTLTYLQWGKLLPEPAERQSVAVVASFTVEPMAPFLEVEAYVSGWRPEIRFVQYAQWQNALVDPATLGGEARRAVVVLLHTDALLPPGTTDVAAAAQRVATLVRYFRDRCATPVLFALLEAPPAPSGLAFGQIGRQAPSVVAAEMLAGLAGSLADIPDAYVVEAGLAPLAQMAWYDPVGYLATCSPLAPRGLIAVSRSVARAMACLFRPRRKVMAVDLDNTIWGGIVGEDGVDGVLLGTEWPGSAFVAFQRTLRTLRDSGILLVMVSKNNESDARAVFERRPEMVLNWEDFTARRVDWADKAANIAAIAEELGLGLDSFVFADDSPMECERVRSALPSVEVVDLGPDPARYPERILRTGAFDTLGVSFEDRARAESYRQNQDRQAQRAHVGDLDAFLADSELRLAIRPAEAGTRERIFQLVSKTNQFNFALERLSKEAVNSLVEVGDALYSAHLSDRFGDYGLIGVLHVDTAPDALRICNMLISCRALGRQVEHALLAFSGAMACEYGLSRVVARCLRGPRNQQVFDFLDAIGFSRAETGPDHVDFSLDLRERRLPWPQHVRVGSPLEREAAA